MAGVRCISQYGITMNSMTTRYVVRRHDRRSAHTYVCCGWIGDGLVGWGLAQDVSACCRYDRMLPEYVCGVVAVSLYSRRYPYRSAITTQGVGCTHDHTRP